LGSTSAKAASRMLVKLTPGRVLVMSVSKGKEEEKKNEAAVHLIHSETVTNV